MQINGSAHCLGSYHYVINSLNAYVRNKQVTKGLNVWNTHPNLSVVISRSKESTVPGESAASDAVLVAAQCVDTLPGLDVPQLGAESKASRRLKEQKYIHHNRYVKSKRQKITHSDFQKSFITANICMY